MNRSAFRFSTTITTVLIAASLGTMAGYGIGLLMMLNLTQNSLFRYAEDHSIDFERPPDETHDLLITMNSSPYARCSEEELAFLRRLMLKSHFTKDLGRMRGDQLECSATLTREELTEAHYEPSFPGNGGTLVYLHLKTLQVGSLIPIVIRMGDSYAAMDPYNRNVLPPAVQFTLNSQMATEGKSPYLGGDHTNLPANVLTRDGSGRVQDTLYATRCSKRYASCLTLYLPLQAAMKEQHRQIELCAVSGGIIGGSFGLMGSMLYRRKKGIEQQLRRAIQRGSLNVVYQPLVDLSTRKVIGAEALVRWTDEDHLAIAPDVFVKIAEERGFVNQITRLVIRRVLSDFGGYLTEHPDFYINVNIAASDLTDPAFQPMVETALREAKVLPQSLGIEITERAMANHKQAIEVIADLRSRGHRVYIDDFGTGYSSLSYLKDLAVDGIKIDRAFTQSIATDSVTVGILPQIISMAETLNLKVVAEGVETETQHVYYRTMTPSLTAQGWLYGHPLSPDEFKRRWTDNEPLLAGNGQAAKPRMPGEPDDRVRSKNARSDEPNFLYKLDY